MIMRAMISLVAINLGSCSVWVHANKIIEYQIATYSLDLIESTILQ
jgi:hypothetical protein